MIENNLQWLEECFDKKISDSVQIVGIGEVSHGGIEPMAFQTKMIQYLVEKKGYRNILFERSDFYLMRPMRNYLNDCGLMNNTMKNGWIKDLQPLPSKNSLILFAWLKKFNMAHPKDMVMVAGFEMITEPTFFNYVLNNYIIPFDPAKGTEYSRLLNNVSDLSKLQKIRSWFYANKNLLINRFQPEEIEWLNFYITNLEFGAKQLQMMEVNYGKGSLYRDSIMAENVRYLARSNKTILIAHNAHLVRSDNGLMGTYLYKYYRSNYYVMLSDFSKKATVEIDQKNIQPVNGKHYIIKSYFPDPTTAPAQILREFGIASGIFQHKDLINFRVLDRTNNIDRYGLQFMSPARKLSFDSLVIFENINPKN